MLNAIVTAEATRRPFHLLDDSPCECITDKGRQIAPHRFSANLYGVPQNHIRFRYAFAEQIWNRWRFAFATTESNDEQRCAAWIYDTSKHGPQLHIWRTENRRAFTIVCSITASAGGSVWESCLWMLPSSPVWIHCPVDGSTIKLLLGVRSSVLGARQMFGTWGRLAYKSPLSRAVVSLKRMKAVGMESNRELVLCWVPFSTS